MTHPTLGDKMALTGKVMELKLGKSFDSGVHQTNPAFHTFRYDFKPASVDASQMARVDVEQRNQISVTVPHHDSSASTVFRGSQRPYQKECVLIIDHKTGEVTLERLSCNVQLKKTRAEGSSKVSLGVQPGAPPGATGSHGRPLTPISSGAQGGEVLDQPPPAAQNSKMKRPSPPMPPQRAHASSPVSSGTPKQRISPVTGAGPGMQPSASSRGTKGGSPGSAAPAAARRPAPAPALSANSMPLLLDDCGRLDETGLNLQQQPHHQLSQPSGALGHYGGRQSSVGAAPSLPVPDSNTEVVEMSEGSSSSSSGSSSEGSDSESDSETAQTARRVGSAAPANPLSVPTLPVTNSSSAGYGSHVGHHSESKGAIPKLSQLSEDLQLSESGSDSD